MQASFNRPNVIGRVLLGSPILVVRLLPTILVVVLVVSVPANALVVDLYDRADDSVRGLLLAYAWESIAWALVLGAVAAVVSETYERSRRASPGEALRRFLPRALGVAAATLVSTVAIFVGLILLVLPGILISIWLSLVPQAIVIDRTTWGAALGRSYDLVRRRSLGVVLLLLGMILLQGVVSYFAPTLLEPTEGFAFAWLGYVIWDLLLGPLQGVIFAVLYYHLLALERDEPDPTFAFA